MIFYLYFFFFFFFTINQSQSSNIQLISTHDQTYHNNLPVIIWHGLGDAYSNPGITRLVQSIQQHHPQTLVYLIHFSDRADEDQLSLSLSLDEHLQKLIKPFDGFSIRSSISRKATWYGNANSQVELVCKELETIQDLKSGFDAIGFSQGGQLLRAYVERCNRPQVRNLITLGAQHMGVSDYPACRGLFDVGCQVVKRLISSGTVYSAYAQEHIIPAQYFRDQADLEPYFQHNAFLRDINNERSNDRQPDEDPNMSLHPHISDEHVPRNQTYKQNLLLLKNFVMFSFSHEEIVKPAVSAYFGVTNISSTIEQSIPLEQLPIYQDDYIGLKELDQSGRLSYASCEGLHMQIDDECWERVMDWIGDGPQRRQLVIQA